MKKVTTNWQRIEKLLATESYDLIRLGVLSVAFNTSEFFRFWPIAEACKAYTQLDLNDAVAKYTSGLPPDANSYTLRQLVNDYSKLSQTKHVQINYKSYMFSKENIGKILRLSLPCRQ